VGSSEDHASLVLVPEACIHCGESIRGSRRSPGASHSAALHAPCWSSQPWANELMAWLAAPLLALLGIFDIPSEFHATFQDNSFEHLGPVLLALVLVLVLEPKTTARNLKSVSDRYRTVDLLFEHENENEREKRTGPLFFGKFHFWARRGCHRCTITNAYVCSIF